jgi:hypothetical protein
MQLRRPDAPPLPCPECRQRGVGGNARIGSRRSLCGTCNRFNQAVSRTARSLLADKHPDEYSRIRLQVECELYPQVIESFVEKERLNPDGGQS